MGGLRESFDVSDEGLLLWPIFQSSARGQFLGADAMRNCLWLNLFEHLLGNMPRQRLGLYLFENQPWEMAFLWAWKNAGHGTIIGVSHSTMLFWDTRYFKDIRDTWRKSSNSPMPWPDAVAINGPLMLQACLDGGYPPERLRPVEALRFPERSQLRSSRNHTDPLRVLILCEYSHVLSQDMIDVAVSAASMVVFGVVITVRPHPAQRRLEALELGPLAVDRYATIADSVGSADLVICGAFSSASIDGAIGGARVALLRNWRAFSSNPADGLQGVEWVSNGNELARTMSEAYQAGGGTRVIQLPFIISAGLNLDKWRGLIGGTRGPRPRFTRGPI
jgi:surface carbohydrate biosynthesis protein (TIGR04326 family)